MNRYETILQSFEGVTNGNSSGYIDASRKTRSAHNFLSEREKEIISVSSGVAGPVLCSYVLWILSRSIEMGLKRLYFVSRDGELLLEIARRLLPAFWPNQSLELRYLWGSRQAWMLPSMLASSRDLELYALLYFDQASLKTIFNRVELNLGDCETVLPRHGFATSNWERRLVPADLEPVKALLRDPDTQARIVGRAKEAKTCVLGYLEQEGLFDDVPYGMVDLGWAGVQKSALEGILSLKGKSAPPFFFFGRTSSKCHDDLSAVYTYQFDVDQAVGLERELPGITMLMEMFCASFSGSLRRYEYLNGRYDPILHEMNIDAVREWGFETMRRRIVRFSENLADHASEMRPPFFLSPEMSHALLKAFWRKPTAAEARAWGQFPFHEDTSGAPPQRLVPSIGPVNFWHAFWRGRGFEQYTEWSRGIAAAKGPTVGFFWRACLAGYKARMGLKRLLVGRKNG